MTMLLWDWKAMVSLPRSWGVPGKFFPRTNPSMDWFKGKFTGNPWVFTIK